MVILLACSPKIPPPPPPPPPPPEVVEEVTDEAYYARKKYERELKERGYRYFKDSIYTIGLKNPKLPKRYKKLLKRIKNGCDNNLNCLPIFPIHYGFTWEENQHSPKIIYHIDYHFNYEELITVFEPSNNDKVYNKKIYIYSKDQQEFTAKVSKQERITQEWGCMYIQSSALEKLSQEYKCTNGWYSKAPLLGSIYPLELEYLEDHLCFARLKNIPNIYFNVDSSPSLSIFVKLNDDEYANIWKFKLPDDSCR